MRTAFCFLEGVRDEVSIAKMDGLWGISSASVRSMTPLSARAKAGESRILAFLALGIAASLGATALMEAMKLFEEITSAPELSLHISLKDPENFGKLFALVFGFWKKV